MDTNHQSPSDLLKAARADLRLNQPEIAAYLDVHFQTVSAWERGRQLPPGRLLERALRDLRRELRHRRQKRRHKVESKTA